MFFDNTQTRQDNFGFFNLFGEDPFDPMFETRSLTSNNSFDPLENMISSFTNMMRLNRANVFNVDWLENINDQVPNSQRRGALSKNEISKIDKQKFLKEKNVKKGEEEKCPVCLMEFEDKEEIKKLPCKHMYHPGCIDTWLKRSCKCPICKRDVREGLKKT